MASVLTIEHGYCLNEMDAICARPPIIVTHVKDLNRFGKIVFRFLLSADCVIRSSDHLLRGLVYILLGWPTADEP